MKKPVIAMCALVFVLAAIPGNRTATADEASRHKQELQRIKREMREKRKKIKRADKRERSILADLNGIDRAIQAGQTSLAEQQRRLLETEAALREIEKDGARIDRDLGRLKREYASRIRALYIMSRSGGTADIVLASDDLDGALKRIKYLGIIAERDRSLMRTYGDSLDALAARQAAISEKRASIVESKRAIETQRADYRALKRKKAVLLANVRDQKDQYEEALHELEESSANLWDMIKKAERERAAANQSVHAAVPRQGRLPWPADGPVLTRFGLQRHPQFKTKVFRRGIEIAVREGAAVRAVQDGQVAYADWYKGFGMLVIIEHTPGFYTLYGNLSQLDVAKGNPVAGGQVIGRAGDTGSLRGAKLYFEIRRNGQAQDPLAWLVRR
jgi:septal ring factor EnvC (AmiA/AmiB activator)